MNPPGIKRAILVGIDEYQVAKNNLHGCVNDIVLVQKLLPEFGFEEQNITVIKNQVATQENILAALEEAISKTETDDALLFYFSGHGSEIVNKEKPNGHNETIVPHDGRLEGGEDIRDITDDMIREILNKKKSNNIALVFDSCHSGDVTREGRTFRGHDIEGIRGIPPPDNGDEVIERTCKKNRITYRGAPGLPGGGWLECDNYVVLSACRDRQLAREKCFSERDNKKHGYLTHHLCAVLERIIAEGCQNEISWMQVFEALTVQFTRQLMKKLQQEPTLEGCRDWQLFGFQANLPDHHVVARVNADLSVILNAGFLHGINANSEWELFDKTRKSGPFGMWKPQEMGVKPTTTVLKCVDRMPGTLDVNEIYHALCRRHLFKRCMQTFLCASLNEVTAADNAVQNFLRQCPFIIVTDDSTVANYQIAIADNKLQILDKQRKPMPPFTVSLRENETFTNSFGKLAWHHSVHASLADLSTMSSDSLRDCFSLYLGRASGEKDVTHESEITLKEGEWFYLIVKNKSKTPFYVTLIEYTMNFGVEFAFPPFGVEGRVEPKCRQRIPADNDSDQICYIPTMAIADDNGCYRQGIQLMITTAFTDFSWMWQEGVRTCKDAVEEAEQFENVDRGDEPQRNFLTRRRRRSAVEPTIADVHYASKSLDVIVHRKPK